ncbi:hypothetical protein MAPG_02491 [Magnaporthiopsis poae ATCC 64411]|uniref:Uncharacterized protein n=1 Tax=Magnaporthiopsis poae (strain ATCC 64411 / 73-15) TaxID=644358 RepID=A0A0C4DRI2_MAGP6|nr:hypothetical protein MAPG_02491 [Magnaporthiopsis poae ATCC 64411]
MGLENARTPAHKKRTKGPPPCHQHNRCSWPAWQPARLGPRAGGGLGPGEGRDAEPVPRPAKAHRQGMMCVCVFLNNDDHDEYDDIMFCFFFFLDLSLLRSQLTGRAGCEKTQDDVMGRLHIYRALPDDPSFAYSSIILRPLLSHTYPRIVWTVSHYYYLFSSNRLFERTIPDIPLVISRCMEIAPYALVFFFPPFLELFSLVFFAFPALSLAL